MNQQIIGTCSLCGGAVTLPVVWYGIFPPTLTCSRCGAVKASHGPVIDMQPSPRRWAENTQRLTPFKYETAATTGDESE